MPTGDTNRDAVTDSLPTMIMGARMVQEQPGHSSLPALCDRQMLGEGLGQTWREIAYERITAAGATDSTRLDNPQQLVDTPLSITPTLSLIHVFYTRLTVQQVIASAASIIRNGQLLYRAIERKKDVDGVTVGQAATTDLGNTANPLNSNLVSHAKYRISSNTTEPKTEGPWYGVFHGFGLTDLDDEQTSGVGTYLVQPGLSQEVFQQSWTAMRRPVGGVQLIENGNITIVSNGAEGFIFAGGPGGALPLVEQPLMGGNMDVRYNPLVGSGGWDVVLRDFYAYGERSAGNWLFSISHDATAPA